MIRLDKFLADTGMGTRSEARAFIKKGLVSVNKAIIKDPGIKVDENRDVVSLSGSEITYKKYQYFMMNKPQGYVSATEDKKEHTVLELIKENGKKDLFPVGRLDKDTEGLLLISNDGDMAHKLLSPAKHVGKVYYAKVSKAVTEEHVKKFAEGMTLSGGLVLKPGELKILKCGEESEIELKIYEGRFHQVKRMFEAIGMKVLYLKRISMGSLTLDEGLKPGAYRRLTDEEVRALKGLE